MRKLIVILGLFLAGVGLQQPKEVWAYNFGDYRSVTLTTKAWQAFENGDIEGVLAYTNKCLELYAEQAKKMQAELTDYAKGTNEEIFRYWALNDVATSLFIQAEAYRKANMLDEAKEVYQKIIDAYALAQCWDPKGWFWKPAEVAKERLANLENKSEVDFGDNSSSTLTTKAWEAYNNNDVQKVLAYTNKCIDTYGAKAKEMQKFLTEFPSESKEKIFSFWALNDVGTCLFIKGNALSEVSEAGSNAEAKEAYKDLIEHYFFAQCWDPQGWFWKPAEAAQQKLAQFAEK